MHFTMHCFDEVVHNNVMDRWQFIARYTAKSFVVGVCLNRIRCLTLFAAGCNIHFHAKFVVANSQP